MAQNRPEALERFYQLREALETAWLEFTYKNAADPGGDIVSYAAGLAGPDAIMIELGNQYVVVGGNPERGDRPHSALGTPTHTWAHDHDGLFVTMSDTGPSARENVFAMRALAASFYLSYRDIDETLWRDLVPQPGVRRYSEWVEDD